MKYGIRSEVGRIDSILIKHPKDAFISQEQVDGQWKDLNYTGRPDYHQALKEYESFVDILAQDVSEIHYLPRNDTVGLDSLYARDAIVMTPAGAILCNMGKDARRCEPTATGERLRELGIPILGSITEEGKLEGGDLIWLDGKTLVVGQGYRTNDEGIRQLRELTIDVIDDLVIVPLPHWKGPEDVFHLMSIISPVDHDLAVVYSRLMPVPFREFLLERGIKLLDVPDEEYDSMACNILALAPRKCLIIAGNPRTKRLLEIEGVEVFEYQGEEISKKGAGGPTCLTRPLLRLE
jgi:N-dimethylarginine dimethylaminohydrolase